VKNVLEQVEMQPRDCSKPQKQMRINSQMWPDHRSQIIGSIST